MNISSRFKAMNPELRKFITGAGAVLAGLFVYFNFGGILLTTVLIGGVYYIYSTARKT